LSEADSLESGAALRRCTGLSRDVFASAYWAREPLLSQHSEGFSDLLSAADVDELVSERGLRTPFFRVVRDGGTVAGTTRTAAAGNRRINDLVSPDAVREAYDGGATLVLNSLHRMHPPLVRFCRRLAAELGHATQCNAYVTPPGSQGFAAHHDTHDVFVLQVDGSKRWNIYAPALTLPLSFQPSKTLAGDEPLVPAGTPPLLSVTLGPGDAIYLPRGFIHAAETNEQRSIHLTVGVLATTAYDVVRDVLELIADDETFRRPLPLGGADEQLSAVAEIIARAADWLRALPADAAREAVRPRVSRRGGPEPLGMLATEDALMSFSKEASVRPREGLNVSLHSDPAGRLLLTLPDRELSLPAYVEPALRSLLERPCRVSELDLPVDDALVLVRRLLREGVVTVAS
jgi:ribosomal protein L16 Arg81 hydroxylase